MNSELKEWQGDKNVHSSVMVNIITQYCELSSKDTCLNLPDSWLDLCLLMMWINQKLIHLDALSQGLLQTV